MIAFAKRPLSAASAIACTVGSLGAQSPLTRTVDPINRDQNVLHYGFAIVLPDTGARLDAEALLTVRMLRAGAPVVLDFSDSLTVKDVILNRRSVPYTRAGDRLTVPTTASVGDTVTVDIHYTGHPPDGLFTQQNVHGARSVFADNWPNRAHYWLPVEDHPSDKASVSWAIEVPRGWRAIANGRFVDSIRVAGGRTRWRYDEPRAIPAYTFVIGAGVMAVTLYETATHVPQSVWTFPEDSAFAVDGPFKRVNRIVESFTDYVGPFPYPSLAHVESSTRFGGMENSGAIFYTENGYARRTMGEGVVAHETAHQWFGDAATEYDWHHLWLSEGFATYFAAFFYELIGEPDTFAERMASAKQSYLASDVVARPILDFAETDYLSLLNANNYPKGAWVLHMLRRLVGDDAFQRGIRDYYATYRDSTALSQDFRAVMERAFGHDLGWFFLQWLTQPGYPQLRVTVTRDAGTVAVEQVQPAEWGLFRIPVRVEVLSTASGQRAGVTLDLTERTGRATLSLPAGADSILVDPRHDVLLTAETRFGTR